MSTEQVPATDSTALVASHQSDHVNLRVTYLHAGNPRPPHNVGAIAVSATIGELKSRLQTDLLEHPRPEEQRLIYQGRPLMDINVTLKEALRLEVGTRCYHLERADDVQEPIGPLPYTIHIIIQPRRAPSHFRPTQTSMAQPAQISTNGGLPVEPPANVSPEQRRALDLAYAHMNGLQRQLAAEMPQNVRTTVHVQHMNTPTNAPSGTLPTQTSVPNLQAASMAQQQHQRLHVQAHMNALQHHMNAVQTHLAHPNTTANATSTTANPVEARLPQMIPGAPPFRRPSSAPGVPRHRQTASTGARRPLAANLNNTLPHLPPPQVPFYNPPIIPFPRPAPTNIGQPTVWLASSRNGPQALLFAPGHGFFSTNSTPSQSNPTPTPTTQPTAPQPDAAAQPAVPPNARGGQVAIRPGGLPLPPRPQDRNQADNEFWALVVQRGWLFLRLYMFIFVLSESGSWQRYGLLLLAAVVCLLPRENPLNNIFVVARRHIDNLIGPPHPQPRDRERDRATRQRQQQGGVGGVQGANTQQNQTAGNAPAAGTRTHVRGAVTTTPEQTARRLLRQHEQQNPNVLRDAFYRVEQAVALFLASLIPGVGERHVAAREEARREEERDRAEERAREEEEKKRLEEQQKEKEKEGQSAAGGESSKAASAPGTAAAGEGVSTTADEGGPRTVETGVASAPGHAHDGGGDGDRRANFT